jgi:hypothetical protein
MFTPKKLKAALEIFKSLYPDHINNFQLNNNVIRLVIDDFGPVDFKQVAFDFNEFSRRNVFTITAVP